MASTFTGGVRSSLFAGGVRSNADDSDDDDGTPSSVVPTSGACTAFRLDVNAASFGTCLCGLAKKDHGQQSGVASSPVKTVTRAASVSAPPKPAWQAPKPLSPAPKPVAAPAPPKPAAPAAPAVESSSPGPCKAFQLDMTAARFGACKCGFTRVEHVAQPAAAAAPPPKPASPARAQSMAAAVPNIQGFQATSVGSVSTRAARFSISSTPVHQAPRSPVATASPPPTAVAASPAVPAAPSAPAVASKPSSAVTPPAVSPPAAPAPAAPPLPAEEANGAKRLSASKPAVFSRFDKPVKPHFAWSSSQSSPTKPSAGSGDAPAQPCTAYSLDMTAPRFGDCVCGFAKLDHAQTAPRPARRPSREGKESPRAAPTAAAEDIAVASVSARASSFSHLKMRTPGQAPPPMPGATSPAAPAPAPDLASSPALARLDSFDKPKGPKHRARKSFSHSLVAAEGVTEVVTEPAAEAPVASNAAAAALPTFVAPVPFGAHAPAPQSAATPSSPAVLSPHATGQPAQQARPPMASARWPEEAPPRGSVPPANLATSQPTPPPPPPPAASAHPTARAAGGGSRPPTVESPTPEAVAEAPLPQSEALFSGAFQPDAAKHGQPHRRGGLFDEDDDDDAPAATATGRAIEAAAAAAAAKRQAEARASEQAQAAAAAAAKLAAEEEAALLARAKAAAEREAAAKAEAKAEAEAKTAASAKLFTSLFGDDDDDADSSGAAGALFAKAKPKPGGFSSSLFDDEDEDAGGLFGAPRPKPAGGGLFGSDPVAATAPAAAAPPAKAAASKPSAGRGLFDD